MDAGDWTSLEVVKLAVGALTPILVGVFGWHLNTRLKRLEDRQWTNRKLIERRLELYERMAPRLNRLLCVLLCIGDFRNTTPPQVLDTKRELDADFRVYKFLMSPSFADAYTAFITNCFREWGPMGSDAGVRSDARRQRAERGDGAWQDGWEPFFTGDPVPDADLRASYDRLMRAFAEDVGLHEAA